MPPIPSPSGVSNTATITTLDDGETQCNPDLLQIKAEDAGLQMSNTSWKELEEDSLESAAPDDNNDEGHDADRDEDFGKAPSKEYHTGVYVRSNMDRRLISNSAQSSSANLCKQPKEDEELQGDLDLI